MLDEKKTKAQLVKELQKLRASVAVIMGKKDPPGTSSRIFSGSEVYLHEIYDLADDVIFMVDREGTFTYVNEYAARFLGHPRKHIIGKNLAHFFPPGALCLQSQYLREVVESGKKVTVEDRVSFDNRNLFIETKLLPVFDREGIVEGILGFSRDITDRKGMEDKLRQSEEKYRYIADYALVGIYTTDIEGTVHYVNKALLELTEYESLEEFQAVNVLASYKNPEDRKKLLKELKKHGRVNNFKTELLTKTGKVRNAFISAVLQGDMIFGMIIDITNLTKAETALRASEEKYRDLYDNAPDMYHTLDRNGVITECNETEARMLGYKKEEIIGRHLADFFTPESKRFFEDQFPKLNKEISNFTVEREFVRKDGTTFPASLSVHSEFDDLGKLVRTKTIARDITERKKTEEEIYRSEARYRTLAEAAQDMIFIISEDDKITYVNKFAASFVRRRPEDVIGRLRSEIFPPDVSERQRKNLETVFNSGKPLYVEDIVHLEDIKVWLGTNLVPLRDNSGTVNAVLGISRDITERRKMEEALRESEERFRSIFDNASIGIAIVDKDGFVIAANEADCNFLGYSQHEIVGMHFSTFTHPEDVEIDRSLYVSLIGGEIGSYEIEKRYIRRDGETVWGRLNVSAVLDSDGEISYTVVLCDDISARKKMEEDLLQIHKLDSIGILAGGIAHDFNNILTAILGNLTLASMYAKPGDELFTRLIEAEKATMRARELTQQLLTFSKGGSPIRQAVSIRELIEKTASFALQGSNVKCEYIYPDEIWPVNVDKGQISQVIHNIVINSNQAMPDGGIILFQLENVVIVPEENIPLTEGRYVKIKIMDRGVGIRKEYLKRIFEPYFTTKQKGNGLGLAISYSIIRKHDGYIYAESEIGAGTTFYIFLPALSELPEDEKPARDELLTGEGRILLMDDEEMVRVVAGEMLRQLGYLTEFAENGDEAIKLYKRSLESGRPYRAVIMDLTIPGAMGGKEAIKKLLNLDPHIKAIVSSGYSHDTVMANHRQYGFADVLAKPYKIFELGRILSRVIKGATTE